MRLPVDLGRVGDVEGDGEGLGKKTGRLMEGGGWDGGE